MISTCENKRESKKAAASSPGTGPEDAVRVGRKLHAGRQYEAALAHYDQAIRSWPNQAGLYNERGRALNNLGHICRARDDFTAAIELEPRHARAHFNLGHVCHRLNDRDDAERAFRSALKLSPDDVGAINALGLLHLESEADEKAEQFFLRSLSLRPDDAGILCNLGVCQLNLEKFPEAVSSLDRCTRVDPDFRMAWTSLGIAYFELGELRRSIEAFAASYSLDKADLTLLSWFTAARSRQGDGVSAGKLASEALALPPADFGMHPALDYIRLGDAARHVGLVETASQCYRMALGLDPSNPSTHLLFAAALTELGELQEALHAIDRCLLYFPRHQSALALRITILQRLGRTDEARCWQDFDALLRVDDIGSCEGFDSIAALNLALEKRILAEITLEYERRGNATRGGRHTGVLDSASGPYRYLATQIEDRCRRFMSSCLQESGHPFKAAQPNRWHLQMWAVVMGPRGHQVPHTHDDGHISGVYYVRVPHEVRNNPKDRQGWLELGRPAMGLAGDDAVDVTRVEPRPGRMVLFPSYFVHGTIPFHSDEPRICIAFDLRPIAWRSDAEACRHRRAICHQDRLSFLDMLAATEAPHSERRLLDHLCGVFGILSRWGERSALCNAGLFHSIYGTESFRGLPPPPGLRSIVRLLIGFEAERLAWLFGILRKSSLYQNLEPDNSSFSIRSRLDGRHVELTRVEFRDLVCLTVANWLEQAPEASGAAQQKAWQALESLRSHLGETARRQFDADFAAYSANGRYCL